MKFDPKHIEELNEQDATKRLTKFWTPEHSATLVASPWSYTVKVNGRILACAGVIEMWKNRGQAWAIIDASCKADFLQFHRAAKRFLEICPFDRIEAQVDYKFTAGHRWMKLLGFRCESTLMSKYFPDGRDAALYSKVRA